jgi:hypothetical protein
MGQTIFELYDRVKAFDVEEEIKKLVKESEPEIIEMNQEQMFAGFRSDDSSISPEYTSYTKKLKAKRNQPTDRVTLKDTGSFYKLMKLDGMKVISTDEKFDSLKSKYGDSIMGLDKTDISKLTDDKLNPGITAAFQAIL